MENELNISYFNGSKNSNSDTHKIISDIIKKLNSNMCRKEIQTNDLSSKNIEYCIGCTNCFNQGICSLNDDMEYIKQKLINSDLIILGSPVYLNNVNGYMKIFLDRLAYWTHIMPLLGKKCIIVVSTQNSGLDETVKYLYEIATYWGLDVIGSVTHRKNDVNSMVDYQIDLVCKRFLRTLYRNEKFIPSEFSETVFKTYQRLYQTYEEANYEQFESKYWKENGYLKSKDLLSIVENKVNR